MAKLKPGPFGLPTGRIGNTVFYILNGQGVCRSIGDQKKSDTPKQKANRTKLTLTMDLLKPLQKFIKMGFEHKAKGTVCNSFNLATAYNKNYALQGEYPNLSINYKEVKLSSGDLPLAEALQIDKTEGGLKVSWNPVHQWAGDQYDDLVMIALYHPKHKKASLFLNAGKRDQGECFVHPENEKWLNEPMEAYLCFKSADGTTISDSIYLGNINETVEEIEKEEKAKKYMELKASFDEVEKRYLEKQALFLKSLIKRKSFNHIEREYKELKDKLENLPGKPV